MGASTAAAERPPASRPASSVRTGPVRLVTSVALDLEALVARLRRVTVVIADGRRGAGAGVVWRPDGLVITNAHVASGPVSVTLADGHRVGAALLARDERRDLAAIRVPRQGLEAAEPGPVATLRVGQLVLAVGHPLGLAGALSVGIVHAPPPAPADDRGAWLVADLRLRPGNSGGPLADDRGRVVGINAMVHGGLALAVPSAAVARFLDEAGLGGA